MSRAAEPASAIAVVVNGDATELPAGTSVAELVRRLQVAGRYAVEINGDIIPRSAHADRLLVAGDRIEVVHAIGGG